MTASDGKTPETTPEPDLDDQDIAAVFSAGDKVVPDFLDQRILAAARDAVGSVDSVDSNDSTTIAQASKTTDKTSLRKSRRWQSSGRWMSMAASLILAVVIAPLMLRSPDSALEQDTVDRSTTKAVEDSVSVTADSIAPEADAEAMRDNSQGGVTMPRDMAPTASPPAPMMPAIRTQKRTAVDDTDEETATDSDFRKTAQSWIEHIRQLQEDERYDDAVREYELFRRKYPKHEPDFSAPLRP